MIWSKAYYVVSVAYSLSCDIIYIYYRQIDDIICRDI